MLATSDEIPAGEIPEGRIWRGSTAAAAKRDGGNRRKGQG
jgi:hypothetical protein